MKFRLLISLVTILISSSSTKIRKSGIFGPKFKNFYFITNICNKANSRVLFSNLTMVFDTATQNTKKGNFGFKFKNFCFFIKLSFLKNAKLLLIWQKDFFLSLSFFMNLSLNILKYGFPYHYTEVTWIAENIFQAENSDINDIKV